MTLSTVQITDDLQRQQLVDSLRRKISVFNTMVAEDGLTSDQVANIRVLITNADNYANFLRRKNSVITLTIDDAEAIDRIIGFEL